MPCFEKIQLSEIKVLRDLSKANLGMLLQISASGLPITAYENEHTEVGLRSEIITSKMRKQGLVLLEGLAAGTFLSDEELSYRPAFDISALARVDVQNCNPHVLADHDRIMPGTICEVIGAAQETILCMAIRACGDDPAVIGYVELAGARCGEVVHGASPVQLGHAVVMRRNSVVDL